ncbi:hypothetical protein [Streptomyces sp. NPDC018055]|uniref:hypothetical protein n=1 Tax=Streptomyces sp. NPDC018055 TaxID=3365038 RepID=UPI001821A2A5|nr:hypothetical protein [Streptomyces sp. SJ1-7]
MLATVVIAIVLVTVIALLIAAGATKLARLDGAAYPAALARAAAAFAAALATIAALLG